MIDLTGKSEFVKTQEEYLSVLKIARLQRFTWARENHLNPVEIPIPNILNFYSSKMVTCRDNGRILCEASELLGTKEITAREFVEWYSDITKCCERECIECVLNQRNTKCHKFLCDISNWKYNIDELLEIAQNGEFTVPKLEEKAVSTIEKFIKNPDRSALNDEFVESLKWAVEKLKKVK